LKKWLKDFSIEKHELTVQSNPCTITGISVLQRCRNLFYQILVTIVNMSSGITFYDFKTKSFRAPESGLWLPLAWLGKGIVTFKALCNKLFFFKALSKQLWKLTIKTKQLSRLKSLSFLNFND